MCIDIYSVKVELWCLLLPQGSKRWQTWLVVGFSGKVSVSVFWAALDTMVVALVSVEHILGCPAEMEHLSVHWILNRLLWFAASVRQAVSTFVGAENPNPGGWATEP